MDVSADVEVVRCCVLWVVNDADVLGLEILDGVNFIRERFDFRVVIALHEDEGDFDPVQEHQECIDDELGLAGLRVEEIAGDYESVRFVFFDEIGEAVEIAFGVTFRDGKAVGAEGCGFAEMEIGGDEDDFFLTNDERVLGK